MLRLAIWLASSLDHKRQPSLKLSGLQEPFACQSGLRILIEVFQNKQNLRKSHRISIQRCSIVDRDSRHRSMSTGVPFKSKFFGAVRTGPADCTSKTTGLRQFDEQTVNSTKARGWKELNRESHLIEFQSKSKIAYPNRTKQHTELLFAPLDLPEELTKFTVWRWSNGAVLNYPIWLEFALIVVV